jgi:S1-C subfamily serine protease
MIGMPRDRGLPRRRWQWYWPPARDAQAADPPRQPAHQRRQLRRPPDIAGQIIKTGRVTSSHRAALGVRVQTVTGPDGQPAGAGIAAVTPGSPAAKAGLQPDVITEVNGTATPNTETLATVLAGLQPGQQVSLSVTNADGSTATVHVTLGQLPGS